MASSTFNKPASAALCASKPRSRIAIASLSVTSSSVYKAMNSRTSSLMCGLGGEYDEAAFIYRCAHSRRHILDAVDDDLLLNLRTVVEIITERVMHSRRAQLRIAVQNVINAIAFAIHLRNQPH